MREVWSHWPGRIFLVVVLGYWIFAHTALQFFFGPETVLFGWMPSPIAVGLSIFAVWLVAFVIYLSRYWPYR